MSKGLEKLHSHSGLERDLKFPKHTVLVDASFASVFHKSGIETIPFRYNGLEYVKVSVLAFIHAGGQFKNLNA